MSSTIEVFCGDCNADQTVTGKIASTLRCSACGSPNMGLTGVDPRPAPKTAAPKGPGTGWGQPHPDPLNGWNEYAGPTPQTFPRIPPVAMASTCPVCHGSGYDLIDKTPCRECGGTGTISHITDRPATLNEDATTSASPAGGAGWHGASLQGGFTAEARRAVAFGDEHTEKYVSWAKQHGHDPDEVSTLKRYESEPGIGRAHTNYLADQLYIGSGDQDWRKHAGRPNTKDPYGPEHQLMHTSPDYASRVGPSVEFDPHNSESFYPKAHDRSPAVRDWSPAPAPAPTRPASGYDPGLGYTEHNHYQMNEAGCPSCGHAPTELRKDKNEDAWWVCPQCGPLANVDANPEINPYSPPRGFNPNRSMKTGGFLARNKRTGRLFTVLARIHEANDLHEREAVELARKTVLAYGEAR